LGGRSITNEIPYFVIEKKGLNKKKNIFSKKKKMELVVACGRLSTFGHLSAVIVLVLSRFFL
jgi:hypothetical protein